MAGPEGDIPNSQNHDKEEDSKKKESSSKHNKSVEELYDDLKAREKKQKIKDTETGKEQGKKEELKEEKEIVSEGKWSKDVVQILLNFISSPSQNVETLQFGLDKAEEKYKKGEISVKQFKKLEKLVKNKLSQLEKEKELEIKRDLVEKENIRENILKKDSRKAEEKKKTGKDSSLEKEDKQASAKNESLNIKAVQDARNKQFTKDEDELNKASKVVAEAIANGKDIPGDLTGAVHKTIEKIVYESLHNLKGKLPEGMLSGLASDFEEERPSSSKENQENYINWYRKKLYAINEEYINERSDTNFTLLWELRQALNSLWAKESDSDDEKKRVNELRQTLTKEFEAHMGLHNFIYLYRRVSGVGDIVTATTLINMRGIEVLMEKKEIVEYLKIFAENGKKIEKLEKEKFKLDWRKGSADTENDKDPITGDEIKNSSKVDKIELEKEKIIKYLKNLQNGEEDLGNGKRKKVENAWAAIMAGGLFSALHGTARYKVVLNTGDFFFGRLYNVPAMAKISWEKQWGRNPFQGLYESLDLGLPNFWRDNIEPKNGEFTVNDLLNKKFDKDDGELTKEAVKGLDSDDIRKLILKPGQLVDELTDTKLKFMLEKFQHKKGAERSKWYTKVLEQEILYYRDKALPGIESWPSWLRRSNSKKDHPSIRPWTKETIKWKIIGFGRILTDEDREYLLGKFVGNKFQRGSAEFAKTSTPVILSTIWGGIKGFFAPLFKYLFGDIK